LEKGKGWHTEDQLRSWETFWVIIYFTWSFAWIPMKSFEGPSRARINVRKLSHIVRFKPSFSAALWSYISRDLYISSNPRWLVRGKKRRPSTLSVGDALLGTELLRDSRPRCCRMFDIMDSPSNLLIIGPIYLSSTMYFPSNLPTHLHWQLK